MVSWQALGAGLAGALTLTAVHETVRRKFAYAPRMDVLGMRAIAKPMQAIGLEPPPEAQLRGEALAGDIVANSLYYSLVGLGKPQGAVGRGALLGFAAGLGALLLPGPLGLGTAPSNRTTATQAMTVAWYTLGGVAAGAAYEYLGNPD